MQLLLKFTKLLMVSPEIMNEVFKQRKNLHYTLRHTSQLSKNAVDSVYNGTESASYLGPKICQQTPSEIPNKKSLEVFKRD